MYQDTVFHKTHFLTQHFPKTQHFPTHIALNTSTFPQKQLFFQHTTTFPKPQQHFPTHISLNITNYPKTHNFPKHILQKQHFTKHNNISLNTMTFHITNNFPKLIFQPTLKKNNFTHTHTHFPIHNKISPKHNNVSQTTHILPYFTISFI